MNRSNSITLIIFFLCALLSAHVSANKASSPSDIVIIHSYSMGYEWTAGEDKGIMLALDKFQAKKPFHANLERFFLEGKKNKESPALIQQKIEAVKKRIERQKPDGVILTDDLAAKLFYNYLHERGIPFTFCGINGFIEKYGHEPGNKGVSGTLERYNLVPTLKIIANERPSIDTVTFIGDISLTTDVIFDGLQSQPIKDELASTNIKNINYFAETYFDQLQDFLLSLDPETDAVVYMTPYTYRDRNEKHVTYIEVDAWASQNTKLLDAGITNYQVKNGRLMSLASNQVESGFYAANVLFTGLANNEDLSKQEIRDYLPLQLILNTKRGENLGVKFPYHILSYSHESMRLFNEYRIK